jgi:hypothetical protein
MLVLEAIDTLLISLYRLTGSPLLNYFIGTFLLAFLSVLIGHATLSLVYRANRKHLERLATDTEKLNQLSLNAMEMGDRKSYKTINKEASDSYGQLFFNRFGLSAASLWPAFFALAWMQERFARIMIPVPWLGFNLNFFVVFLLSYLVARIVFGQVKKCLYPLLGRRPTPDKAEL